MSELYPAGQHPDADQLTAFSEHALPEHERNETLAHLATCAYCRSIVALALHAEEPAAKPLEMPARRFRVASWIWPATAALAAMITVGIYIQSHSGNQPNLSQPQVAVTQPPASAAQPVVPDNASPAPPPAGQRAPLDRADAEPSPARARRPAPPPPAVAGAASYPVVTESLAKAAPGATASRLTENQEAIAILQQHPLPNGSRALSAVAKGQKVLAIDANHAVYLTDDAGLHWRETAAPWSGQAINVAMAAPPAPINLPVSPVPLELAEKKSSQEADAQLNGTVKDATGASIPDASVEVTNRNTQAVYRTQTDADGKFAADRLPAGTYSLAVNANGFEPQQVPDLTLKPAQHSQKDLTLAVGAASQSVTVASAAPAPASRFRANIRAGVMAGAAAPVRAPRMFQITTDTGERWVSSDGQTWRRQ